jgi:hypothetical protein
MVRLSNRLPQNAWIRKTPIRIEQPWTAEVVAEIEKGCEQAKMVSRYLVDFLV